MSWIVDSTLTWFEYIIVNIMKKGHVPKHIAFIMDGNRRYAKRSNAKTIEGHNKGFDKLAETLQWCLDLDVKEVTVYAFSIENFKRTEEEVNGLMDLARFKFKRLIEQKDKLCERGVRVRVLGNIELLPRDLIELIKEAMYITKDNKEALLNVAFSYTSRDEIVETSRILIDGLRKKKISEDDLSMQLFDKCLYTAPSRDPELIIRTSGETRLSDFMLVQSKASFLYFCDQLWPDFSAWNLIKAVFFYQYNFYTSEVLGDKKPLTEKGETLVQELYRKRDEYVASPQCTLQHGSLDS